MSIAPMGASMSRFPVALYNSSRLYKDFCVISGYRPLKLIAPALTHPKLNKRIVNTRLRFKAAY